MDIERKLNSRPLISVRSERGVEQVLAFNIFMWRKYSHIFEARI